MSAMVRICISNISTILISKYKHTNAYLYNIQNAKISSIISKTKVVKKCREICSCVVIYHLATNIHIKKMKFMIKYN